AKIYVSAGKGGAGMVHFRREKYEAKGGPDGGDGGDGGNILIKGNEQLNTLLDLRYKKFVNAENGSNGGPSKRTGKKGDDSILEAPLGSVIFDAESGERLGEIIEHDQAIMLVSGGQGGLGNWRFRSATNRTPRH